MKDNGTKVHRSGSLIHEKYVLSASHCFTEKLKPFVPINELLVVLSVDDVSRVLNPFFQTIHRTIKTVKLHPDYVFPRAYSDVSIIELNQTVPLGQFVSTICLPDVESADPDYYENNGPRVVGFGPHTENATKMNQLPQFVNSHSTCSVLYGIDRAHYDDRPQIDDALPRSFDDTLLCAGTFSGDGGTCPG